MEIAYLTGEYPRATDTWIQREVAGLRAAGVVVHTFSARRTDDEHMVGPEQRSERTRTTYLLPAVATSRTPRAHVTLFVRSPRRYLSALRLMWRTHRPGLRGTARQFAYFVEAGILADELRRRHVRHLHNHFGDSSCTVAMLAARLGGFSYSMTLHGPDIFFDPGGWALPEKVRQARFCVCISYFCRSQVAANSEPGTLDRLHVVHCGVDAESREPRLHEGVGRRLVFVGRLTERKGVAVLLEAMARVVEIHPDVRLTIVGDGPHRRRFADLAGVLALEKNVDFRGYASQNAVGDILSDADVFVLPSFAEGLPVTIMEAFAAGLPVVATGVAGTGELVEDGVNGFLVRPGDPDQLAERLCSLIEDPATRRRFGAAGRAAVATDFRLDGQVARLHRLFECALRSAGDEPTI